jgi:signal recognition particle receptor subunit beta
MVFFNYATMQMAAKIVYYGPGLCGKTTNLHHIYAKTSPQSRGEMVSLETETDRTLFFDLLPIDVGVIGGFKTRLQLYTIPGQVFYNTTRKLVLKGVDGIVFVADSQTAMLDANAESFKNLQENLAEIGLSVDEIPLVLQLNKRDLPAIATPDQILDVLDPERKYEWVEAVAYRGDGVFETLKTISKLTLRTLRRRMTGEEPVKAAPRRSVADVASFRIRDEAPASPARTMAGTAALPSSVPGAAAASAAAPEPAEEAAPPLQVVPQVEEPAPVEEVAPELTPESQTTPLEAAPPAEDVAAPAREPEIDFSQTEKPSRAASEVKHVKVRSNVDIMAELESLRKRATQSTPKPAAAKKEASPLDALRNPPKPKRDLHKTVTIPTLPGTLTRSKQVRVAVSFSNDEGIVHTEEQTIELGETGDVQSLSVNLKFDS